MNINIRLILVPVVIAVAGLSGCDNDSNDSEAVGNPGDEVPAVVGNLSELVTLGDTDDSGLLDIGPIEDELLSLSADDPIEFDDTDTVTSVLNRIGTR